MYRVVLCGYLAGLSWGNSSGSGEKMERTSPKRGDLLSIIKISIRIHVMCKRVNDSRHNFIEDSNYRPPIISGSSRRQLQAGQRLFMVLEERDDHLNDLERTPSLNPKEPPTRPTNP
ncbi:hypothetical protein Trydic_g17016 [Trypoxylus dichotomus]